MPNTRKDYTAFGADKSNDQLHFEFVRKTNRRQRWWIKNYLSFTDEKLGKSYNVYDSAAAVLYNIDPDQVQRGDFTMLYMDAFNEVVEKIFQGPHPNATHRVLSVAIGHAEWDTGRVTLSRKEIAEKAHISVHMVSRAMSLLEKYDAIWRIGKGPATVYAVEPHIGWCGNGKRSPVQPIMIEVRRQAKAAAEAEKQEPTLPL